MIVRIETSREKVTRPAPWLVSLGVHVAFAAFLMLISAAPGRTPSAYDQLLKGREAKIVFYKFKDRLPDVKPLPSTDSRPPKATVVIPRQQIVSSPKNAPKGTQMVWQPVPDIIKQDVPAPNILAVKVPEMPRPEPRKFVPPAEHPRQARDVPQARLPDAPAQLALNAKPTALDNLGVPALRTENRPRFTIPEASSASPQKAQTPQMEAPPAVASPAGAEAALQSALAGLRPSQVNVVVVGLNPADRNAIPHGSRAAEFSAGPKLNPDGGPGGEKGASLSVPDLFVKGGGTEARPTLMAQLNAAPTSTAALRGMSKYASPGRDTPPSEHPAARRVASAPTSRFDGREVYSMAIQMPNITSYSGSWLMWYASRSIANAIEAPISPPVPHRKVDPKYIATAAEERIEGRVQLMCVINGAGMVDHVELLKGIDDRLNQSAMDALSKWQFAPATRGGLPVDVDVMVEIPFKLAPKVPAP